MAIRPGIFEDVEDPQKRAATPGGIRRDRGRARRFVRGWLMILFALVVVMIAVGGLTRLTDSGLAITEWAPIIGAIPPLSQAQWEAEFTAYRAIPEYQLQNRGMTLAQFKVIYWWEWGHRQLGRFIGLVWALGFLGLLIMRHIPPGWMGRLLLLGGLGGLQAWIGWWMVRSGLAPAMLDVASYRLAIHLGLAFVILALLAWFILTLSRDHADLMQSRRAGDRRLIRGAAGLLYLVFLQILVGALVAGIDAGRNYTDWPLMADGLTPPNMWVLEPVWRNLFENDGTVQFFHRLLGYAVAIYGVIIWSMARQSTHRTTKRAFDWALAMILGQMVLGIITVMYSSPLPLAIVHQFGAVVLITLVQRARFLSFYPILQSIRS